MKYLEIAKLSRYEMETIFLSIKVALSAVVLIMPFAVYLGHKLATKKTNTRVLIEVFVLLPTALPPVAVGYMLLMTFGASSPIGKFLQSTFNIRISFNFIGAVIASTIVSMPLAIKSIRVAIEAIDPEKIEAAFTLGAGRLHTFAFIILPLSWNGIVNGAILAFMRSLGEFGATMVLAGNIEGESRTLSIAIWTSLQQPDKEETSIRLLAFSLILGILALTMSEIFSKNKNQEKL